MNIHDALRAIAWDRREYFQWKYPAVRFDQTKEIKSQEDFLRVVSKKTLNPYLRWEKTQEYKALVALMLQARTADDLQEIYGVVIDNAKTGDDKAVKLFLALSREIDVHAKLAIKNMKHVEEDDEDDDDLII